MPAPKEPTTAAPAAIGARIGRGSVGLACASGSISFWARRRFGTAADVAGRGTGGGDVGERLVLRDGVPLDELVGELGGGWRMPSPIWTV